MAEDFDFDLDIGRVVNAMDPTFEFHAALLFSQEFVNFLLVRIMDRPYPMIPYRVYAGTPYRAFNDDMQRAVDYLAGIAHLNLRETFDMMSRRAMTFEDFTAFYVALRIHYFGEGETVENLIHFCIHLVYVTILFHCRRLPNVFSFTAENIQRILSRTDYWGPLNEVAQRYAALNPNYEPNNNAEQLAEETYEEELSRFLENSHLVGELLGNRYVTRRERITVNISESQQRTVHLHPPALQQRTERLHSPSEQRQTERLHSPSEQRQTERLHSPSEQQQTERLHSPSEQRQTKRNAARKSLPSTSKMLPLTSGSSTASVPPPKRSKGSKTQEKLAASSTPLPKRSKSSNAQEKLAASSAPTPKRSKIAKAGDKLELDKQNSSKYEKQSTDIKNEADALTSSNIKHQTSPRKISEIPSQEARLNKARKTFTTGSKMLPSTSGTADSKKLSKKSPSNRSESPLKKSKGSNVQEKSELRKHESSNDEKKLAPSSALPPKRLKSAKAEEKLELVKQKSLKDEKQSTDIKNEADALTSSNIKPQTSPRKISEIPSQEARRNKARKTFTTASKMLPPMSDTADSKKLRKKSPNISESPSKKSKSSSAQEKLELIEQKSSNDENISMDIKDDNDTLTIEPSDLLLERDSTPESEDGTHFPDKDTPSLP